MFTKIALSVALLASLVLAQPPRHNPPPRPVHRTQHIHKTNTFSFKYSLKAHGIECKAVKSVGVFKNTDGTITITISCSF